MTLKKNDLRRDIMSFNAIKHNMRHTSCNLQEVITASESKTRVSFKMVAYFNAHLSWSQMQEGGSEYNLQLQRNIKRRVGGRASRFLSLKWGKELWSSNCNYYNSEWCFLEKYFFSEVVLQRSLQRGFSLQKHLKEACVLVRNTPT
jgi:hypothetical protein